MTNILRRAIAQKGFSCVMKFPSISIEADINFLPVQVSRFITPNLEQSLGFLNFKLQLMVKILPVRYVSCVLCGQGGPLCNRYFKWWVGWNSFLFKECQEGVLHLRYIMTGDPCECKTTLNVLKSPFF